MNHETAKSPTKNPNIIVTVRIRPPSASEHMNKDGSLAVKCMDERVVIFDPADLNKPQQRGPQGVRRGKDIQFAFDRVFDQYATQYEVFQHTTQQLVNEVLNGYNCACFAYGATGAGKTFTMVGNKESPGVMVLTLQELFSAMKATQDDKKYNVKISYLEVYNENIHDLLVPQSKSLSLLESGDTMTVPHLTQHEPESAEEVLQLLQEGNTRRAQNFTHANAESSRSHAVLQVIVEQRDRTANLTTGVRTAKFSLIDLAGSERASKTKNRGKQLVEGANINRSLLALGNCINALGNGYTEGKYVPYRDSKLTRLLKDSLGGNCKTVMISNVSPSTLSYEDTFNTLQYANRAKNIKTKVRANELNIVSHVSEYKDIIADLRKEIEDWKKRCSGYEAQIEEENRARQAAEQAAQTGLEGDDRSKQNPLLNRSGSVAPMLTRTVSIGLATPRNSKTDRKLLSFSAEVDDVIVDRSNTQKNLEAVDAAIREACLEKQSRIDQLDEIYMKRPIISPNASLNVSEHLESPDRNLQVRSSPSVGRLGTPKSPRQTPILRRDIDLFTRKIEEQMTLRTTLMQRLARNAETTKRLQLALSNFVAHADDAFLLRQLKLELSINSLEISNLYHQFKETQLTQTLVNVNEKHTSAVEVIQALRGALVELGVEEPKDISDKCALLLTPNYHEVQNVEIPSPFHSNSPRNEHRFSNPDLLPPSTPSRLNLGQVFNAQNITKSPTGNYSARVAVAAENAMPNIISSNQHQTTKPTQKLTSQLNSQNNTGKIQSKTPSAASAKKPNPFGGAQRVVKTSTIASRPTGLSSLTRPTVSSNQRGIAPTTTTSNPKKPVLATRTHLKQNSGGTIPTNKPFQGAASNSQLVTPTKVSHKYRDQMKHVEKELAGFKPTFAPLEKSSTPGSSSTKKAVVAESINVSTSTPVSSNSISVSGPTAFAPNPLATLMSQPSSSSASSHNLFASLPAHGSVLSRPPTVGIHTSPELDSSISNSPLMSNLTFASPKSPLAKPLRV